MLSLFSSIASAASAVVASVAGYVYNPEGSKRSRKDAAPAVDPAAHPSSASDTTTGPLDISSLSTSDAPFLAPLPTRPLHLLPPAGSFTSASSSSMMVSSSALGANSSLNSLHDLRMKAQESKGGMPYQAPTLVSSSGSSGYRGGSGYPLVGGVEDVPQALPPPPPPPQPPAAPLPLEGALGGEPQPSRRKRQREVVEGEKEVVLADTSDTRVKEALEAMDRAVEPIKQDVAARKTYYDSLIHGNTAPSSAPTSSSSTFVGFFQQTVLPFLSMGGGADKENGKMDLEEEEEEEEEEGGGGGEGGREEGEDEFLVVSDNEEEGGAQITPSINSRSLVAWRDLPIPNVHPEDTSSAQLPSSHPFSPIQLQALNRLLLPRTLNGTLLPPTDWDKGAVVGRFGRSHSICHDTLQRLSPGGWLCDEIINFEVQKMRVGSTITAAASSSSAFSSSLATPSSYRMGPKGASGGALARFWVATSFFVKKLIPGGVEGLLERRSGGGGGGGGGGGKKGGGESSYYNYAGVREWAKRCGVVSLQALDAVLFPVHFEADKHWGVGGLDVRRKEAHLWDSWWRPEREGDLRALLEALVRWGGDEVSRGGGDGGAFAQGWTLFIHKREVPQQNNSCDCGVFTLQFLRALISGGPFPEQKDIPLCRAKLALEIAGVA